MELAGGCACGAQRYRVTEQPLVVHACHCRDCQRITGSAFVVNLWIEREFIEGHEDALRVFRLTGGSGKPHDVFFCPQCGTHLWSRYHGAPGDTRLLRVGTLDEPSAVTPDVHVFTRSKLPWVVLPSGARAVETFYDLKAVWPADMLLRFRAHAASHAQVR